MLFLLTFRNCGLKEKKMHLQRTHCILCGEHIINIQYNLKTTYSEKSNVVLIKFVEHIYKNIFLMHCNICTNCYNLLNEIDGIQLREKELYDKLKSYIIKVNHSSINVKSEKSCKTLPKKELVNPVIEGVNIKKLPIKIKKVTANDKLDQSKICDSFQDKLAFEKVQSIIQMDLNKHEAELSNKNKVSKSMLCDICGQNFKTKLGFENHLKQHSDQQDNLSMFIVRKPGWSCTMCEKVFTQKVSLSRHLLIHSGESRYQCEQCGKKFMHHSSFNIHKKIHLGLRNFKCIECNKGFLTGSHLKRHIRATHTMEKDHSCYVCGKKFAENYNLVAHIKTHKMDDNIFTGIT